MSFINSAYCKLLKKVLTNGYNTGTTKSYPHVMFRYDFSYGFPIISQRRIYLKAAKAEMLWMLTGSNNIKGLGKYKHFWEPWADVHGRLNTSYGRYMVNYPGIPSLGLKDGESGGGGTVDQISYVLDLLGKNPNSRRAIISLWHPDNAINSRQPSCHISLQFTVVLGRLNCLVNARSQDLILGFPYDCLNYGMLTAAIAYKLKLAPGLLSFSIGDAHIYNSHLSEYSQYGISWPHTLALYTKRNQDANYHFKADFNSSISDLIASFTLENSPTEFHQTPKFKLEVNNQVEIFQE